MDMKEKDGLTDVVNFAAQVTKPESPSKPTGKITLEDGREVKLGFTNRK